MQRHETNRRSEPRRQVDHAGALAQEHYQDDRDEVTPESNPASFLTARELEAWDPATSADRRTAASERRLGVEARRIQMPEE